MEFFSRLSNDSKLLALNSTPPKIFDDIKRFSLKYSLFPLSDALYQGSPPNTFTNEPAVSLMVDGPNTGRTM